ncbi:MAG TPA: acyltransferase family protein [Candidatus Binatia bacterium]
MAVQTSPRIPYVAALDGIRGVALVAMLVYHADKSVVGGGYLSVSTFFTLSGFLITTLLLVETASSGRIDLVRFWARRLRRLMPAALLGIALAACFTLLAGTTDQLSRFRWDGLGALFYFANIRFMTTGQTYWEIFTRPSPLQHYWSLSIEEQFYAVYPLLLVAMMGLARLPLRSLRLVLAVLACLSTAIMIGLATSGVAPSRLYYGTDTRAAEFLVGALLATLLVRDGRIQPWRGRGYVAITVAAIAYVIACVLLVQEDSPFLYRGGFALYALCNAALLNAALQPGVVSSVLSWEPFRRLGVVSYGVYIYHWPIYLWLDESRTGLGGLELFALRIGVTFAIAVVSYVALERPVRERRWPTGWVARLAAPVAVAAVAVVVVTTTAGAPGAPPAKRAARASKMPPLGPPFPEGPLRVLTVGDSIAHNVGIGFARQAKFYGRPVTVWNLAEYGCGIGRWPKPGPRRSEVCTDWPQRWRDAVERFRPDLVVIHSGLMDLRNREFPTGTHAPGDEVFDSWLLGEYQLAVDVTSALGARIVWLTTPCFGRTQNSPLIGTGARDPRRVKHLNDVILPTLAAARPDEVTLLDLFARLCPGGRFLEVDPRLGQVRMDSIHLTAAAATDVASWILAETFPSVQMAQGTEAAPVEASRVERAAAN